LARDAKLEARRLRGSVDQRETPFRVAGGGAADERPCKGAKVKSTREPPLVTTYQGTENIRRGEITPFNADLSPD
jgi:hypothetical protein